MQFQKLLRKLKLLKKRLKHILGFILIADYQVNNIIMI